MKRVTLDFTDEEIQILIDVVTNYASRLLDSYMRSNSRTKERLLTKLSKTRVIMDKLRISAMTN